MSTPDAVAAASSNHSAQPRKKRAMKFDLASAAVGAVAVAAIWTFSEYLRLHPKRRDVGVRKTTGNVVYLGWRPLNH